MSAEHDSAEDRILEDDTLDLTLEGVDLVEVPKISLHDHLDGGLRPETIVELADQAGLELPVDDPDELGDWFADSADSGDLITYLKTFDQTVGVMQTADSLARVAREFVEDSVDDGIIYVEARWAPEQHLAAGLTPEAAVEAVAAGFEEGMRDAAERGYQIEANQIVTALRHNDRSLEMAKLAVRYRDAGVVGFDLAGPEKGFLPSRHHEALDYLARSFFPTTVHAGEADGLASIVSALIDGRALRLGHGTHLVDDIQLIDEGDDSDEVLAVLGDVAAWVRDRGIVLETNPSSNLQTGAFTGSFDEHPLDLLYQLDFRVTVNVDNRLQSNTTLTEEFSRVAQAFDYGLDDLAVLTLNAAEGAFLPATDRQDLADRVIAFYDELD
ncbi:adenosine deaminase [Pseudoclavibacter sp. 13-3]|uniref:adenosine deaminase n=1 Tax=Pseudoclavibacter sp. 13-3 TaxID=2901228 RepID=UPI001E4B5E49|nr:adenosine deaminase [Pseudoclavibacter sp. 13-3]MCD7102395.1 adenosine deaminase [Pseudoclavibacter sp. 13-3]